MKQKTPIYDTNDTTTSIDGKNSKTTFNLLFRIRQKRMIFSFTPLLASVVGLQVTSGFTAHSPME
jgi:hypothetical protein